MIDFSNHYFIICMNTVKQSKQASIRRKLVQSGIEKPQQFQQIISNLLNQRERLQTDLQLLTEKVAMLQQKQSQRQATRIRKRPKQKVNFREQLQKKYQQLKQWQKRSSKAMKNTTLQIQYRTNLDKIMSVQQQIQTVRRQLDDEQMMNRRLMKGLKLANKDEKATHNVQNGIQQENYILKKKLLELRKIADKQVSEEIMVHNHLIETKEKERDNQELLTRYKRKSRDSTKLIRRNSKVRTEEVRSEKEEMVSSDESQEIIDLQINASQIASKDEILQIQGRMNRIQKKWKDAVDQIQQKIKHAPGDALNQRRQGSKLTFSKQFELLIERVKSKLVRLTEANKAKITILLQRKGWLSASKLSKRSESSLLPRQGSAFKKQITEGYESNKQKRTPLKNNSKVKFLQTKPKLPTQNVETTTQTQLQQIQGLRRDYIGFIDTFVADDRSVLKQQINSSIRSLQIYYSDRGIATIKATYNLHPTELVKQSKLILPDTFLQNYCQIYLIETASDDFIRYLKVRYNKPENRITQIKIVTNKSIKNGWGDGKIKGQDYLELDQENEVDFVLDINQDEYPVSIFCSHIQKGPYWYLSGLGVQINNL